MSRITRVLSNRFAWPLAAFALLLGVLVSGLVHLPDKGLIVSPLIGKAAPNFTLPNLLNPSDPVSSADLKGHWSLLNVWGTWCYVCRDEHATLLQIAHDSHVPIIGIDWKDSDAQARSWLAQLGDPYTLVGADHSGNVAINFGVYGAPETFLINPQGRIVYKQIGAMTPRVWREQFLPRIDAGAPPGDTAAEHGGGGA